MAVVWELAIHMSLLYPVYINYTKSHERNTLLRVSQNSVTPCIEHMTQFKKKKKKNTFCAQGVLLQWKSLSSLSFALLSYITQTA